MGLPRVDTGGDIWYVLQGGNSLSKRTTVRKKRMYFGQRGQVGQSISKKTETSISYLTDVCMAETFWSLRLQLRYHLGKGSSPTTLPCFPECVPFMPQAIPFLVGSVFAVWIAHWKDPLRKVSLSLFLSPHCSQRRLHNMDSQQTSVKWATDEPHKRSWSQILEDAESGSWEDWASHKFSEVCC